jgi:hypothetical protein
MFQLLLSFLVLTNAQEGQCYKSNKQQVIIPPTPHDIPVTGLCLAELNAKRQKYRGINTSLRWNQSFAKRAILTANQWSTLGHSGTGPGEGGFITGQVMAHLPCGLAADAWIEGEFDSPGKCKRWDDGGAHCQIILNPRQVQVGCSYSSGNTVCNFGV